MPNVLHFAPSQTSFTCICYWHILEAIQGDYQEMYQIDGMMRWRLVSAVFPSITSVRTVTTPLSAIVEYLSGSRQSVSLDCSLASAEKSFDCATRFHQSSLFHSHKKSFCPRHKLLLLNKVIPSKTEIANPSKNWAGDISYGNALLSFLTHLSW